MSTAYHPQTDGQSERTIQTLEDMCVLAMHPPRRRTESTTNARARFRKPFMLPSMNLPELLDSLCLINYLFRQQVISDEASSSNSVNIDVTPNNQLPHVQKWTQAHPLENIIGDKDRPVSTRKQLETDAMWCFFNEFLTHVEPKTYKQACEHSVAGLRHAEKFMIERQDLDEYGDVLKNKARLVAKGYRQEAGIDLKNHLLQLLDKSDSVLIIAHAASLNMVIFKMDVKNPPSSIHTRTE
ncbi:retrovirus-related pol polyprotein from transposon TNT 1-94 [Tanacetum coccineum]